MNTSYNDSLHRLGRIACSAALVLIIMVPLTVSMRYDIFPPFRNFIGGFFQAVMIYLPISIAEFLTFVPILGSGAYLAFITGNLTNLKIPCAVVAMENANVKPATDEGEVIAILAVASSSITTIMIIFFGMLLIFPLMPLLNHEYLKPAFDNVLPALFGALGAYFFIKHWKLAVSPLLFSIVAAFIIIHLTGIQFSSIQGLLIPILGGISVVSALALYKKGWIKKEDVE
ncbi:MAG: hypothetical protein GX808_13590 [Syntrophomonadaceae bacterium]|jgi:hypothetical protein|nr:hypothetical protein [Syntrophomonadaceae bacterium]